MEIKNKLTVTRGGMERDNGVKKGKGYQGTSIKDPGTQTMGREGEEDCKWKVKGGQGRVMGGRNGDNCN